MREFGCGCLRFFARVLGLGAGIDYTAFRVGDRIALGERVLLEVTRLGKECHTGCAIEQIIGDCIMLREGVFYRVLEGGRLRPGDPVHQPDRPSW